MFNLSEICTEIDDQELRAYALTMTLAAIGNDIPESMLKIYLCPCDINSYQMDIHLSVFLGMNLLSIKCDCLENLNDCMYNKLINHDGCSMGQAFLINETLEYFDARDRVIALRAELML